MSRDVDQQAIRAVAHAQADALARWRRSKAQKRAAEYRRRMGQGKKLAPADWLLAVERDDRTDPVERRQLKERAA